MKKFLSLFLCLTCILTLAACGKKAAPITLPQADKITPIDITIEENTVSHSDKTWMSEIIADISSSKPTKMSRKRKVISGLTSGMRQEQLLSLRMRTGGSTILNNLIKEFIKLNADCSKG